MKTLITILTLTSTLSLHAQIPAGRITYETKVESHYIFDLYNDDEEHAAPDTTTSSSTYTVDFNERYIRTFVGMDDLMTDYISIQDKTNGKTFFASLNEEKKTVHFIDLGFDGSEENSDSEYYDEYYDDSKPHLDEYHEDFYLELMKIPLNDTIVVPTDETKEILGLSCKKYIMKIKDQVFVLWTTDQVTGMEQIYNLPSQIKGLVMELSLKSKDLSIHTMATVFSTQTTLTNGDLNLIPDGYQLDLGSLYLDSYSSKDESSLSIDPFVNFVEAPDYMPTLKAICKEIDNAIDPAAKKNGYAYADFTITIDEKGNIVNMINAQDEYEAEYGNEYSSIDYNKLSKNVKKKCSFGQPFKVNGKPISSVLHISYSYSDYKDDYFGY